MSEVATVRIADPAGGFFTVNASDVKPDDVLYVEPDMRLVVEAEPAAVEPKAAAPEAEKKAGRKGK